MGERERERKSEIYAFCIFRFLFTLLRFISCGVHFLWLRFKHTFRNAQLGVCMYVCVLYTHSAHYCRTACKIILNLKVLSQKSIIIYKHKYIINFRVPAIVLFRLPKKFYISCVFIIFDLLNFLGQVKSFYSF